MWYVIECSAINNKLSRMTLNVHAWCGHACVAWWDVMIPPAGEPRYTVVYYSRFIVFIFIMFTLKATMKKNLAITKVNRIYYEFTFFWRYIWGEPWLFIIIKLWGFVRDMTDENLFFRFSCWLSDLTHFPLYTIPFPVLRLRQCPFHPPALTRCYSTLLYHILTLFFRNVETFIFLWR